MTFAAWVIIGLILVIVGLYVYMQIVLKKTMQDEIDRLNADREALKVGIEQNLQSADEIEKVRQDSYEKLVKAHSNGKLARFMRTGK